MTTEIKGYVDENFYKQFVLEIWRRNLITREQSAEIERELLGDDLDTHLTKLSKLAKLKLQEPRK